MADSSAGQQPPTQDNPFAGMEVGGSYNGGSQQPAAAAPAVQGNPFDGMEVGGSYQSKKPKEKAAPAAATESPTLAHTAEYAASKGAEALAGLYDLPDTIDKGISYGLNKYAPAVGQAYDAFDKATTLAQVPSATQALYSTGLAGPQGPQPQSPLEKLIGQGVAGAVSAVPPALATGGTSLAPLAIQALSGAAGNISGENLGPYASGLLQMTGLSKGVSDVAGPIAAGGIAGGATAGTLNRAGNALTTLVQGEGPLASLGAAIPGKFGEPNPLVSTANAQGAADTAEAARSAGIDIPAPLWAGSGTAEQRAASVTPDALKTVQGQFVQSIRKEMQLSPGETLKPEDLQAHLTDLSHGPTGYDATLAKIGIDAPAAQQLQDDLTKPGGVLDQLKYSLGSTNPALPKLENTARQLYDQADQGAIPGNIYQTLVNKGSPLTTQLTSAADPDLARGAGIIKDALDKAISTSGNNPDDLARLAELGKQWRLAKAMGPVVDAAEATGSIDAQSTARALSQEYGSSANAPGNLPQIAAGARLLPKLDATGSVVAAPATGGLIQRIGGNVVAGATGAIAATGDLLNTAHLHGGEAAAALMATLAGSGGVKLVNSAQKAYASTPAASQQLMNLIRGIKPPTGAQGALAGASGPLVSAGQPQ